MLALLGGLAVFFIAMMVGNSITNNHINSGRLKWHINQYGDKILLDNDGVTWAGAFPAVLEKSDSEWKEIIGIEYIIKED